MLITLFGQLVAGKGAILAVKGFGTFGVVVFIIYFSNFLISENY